MNQREKEKYIILQKQGDTLSINDRQQARKFRG